MRPTQGRTEEILGTWLARRPRGDLVIATKVAGPGRREWIRGGRTDLTRDVIAEAVDTSLARLQIDCIDLFQIHWPQRNVPLFGATEFDPAKETQGPSIDEQVEGMAAMIRAGKIRHYGLSNETAWGVCEFHRAAKSLGAARPGHRSRTATAWSRAASTTTLPKRCTGNRCRCSPTARSPRECFPASTGAAPVHRRLA